MIDISHEQYRVYIWQYESGVGPKERKYLIRSPVSLEEKGGIHEVVDENGDTHLVPGIGLLGCVVVSKPCFFIHCTFWSNIPGTQLVMKTIRWPSSLMRSTPSRASSIVGVMS